MDEQVYNKNNEVMFSKVLSLLAGYKDAKAKNPDYVLLISTSDIEADYNRAKYIYNHWNNYDNEQRNVFIKLLDDFYKFVERKVNRGSMEVNPENQKKLEEVVKGSRDILETLEDKDNKFLNKSEL